MILHTLNASPSSSAFNDCVKVIHVGDALVLMGDGAYAALEGTRACDKLQSLGIELYLLSADALAVGASELASAFTRLEMDGFVALTERFPRQQAWY